MFRATTPTHTFTFPFAVSELNWTNITYSQDGNILLQKNKSDCVATGYTLVVVLTQAETKLFVKGDACIQVRYGKTANESLASPKTIIAVEDVLNDATLPA